MLQWARHLASISIYRLSSFLATSNPSRQKWYIRKRHPNQCCSHKTFTELCRGVLTLLHHATALVSCSRAIPSADLKHLIYTRNNAASPSDEQPGGWYAGSYQGAETQAVLFLQYISTTLQPCCQPTHRLLQRYGPVLESCSLLQEVEEEEARRRKKKLTNARLRRRASQQSTYICLRSTIQIERSIKHRRRSPPPYLVVQLDWRRSLQYIPQTPSSPSSGHQNVLWSVSKLQALDVCQTSYGEVRFRKVWMLSLMAERLNRSCHSQTVLSRYL
jgi:hypothetical protein